MKKIYVVVLSTLLTVACSSKEEKVDNGLSQKDIENLQETSQLNSDQIEYEGKFKGKIKGKEIELTINDDSFDISENGKKAHGDWAIVNDGSTIELEPSSGTVSVRYYGISDNDTWIALTDSATYPDNEEFIKRIPD